MITGDEGNLITLAQAKTDTTAFRTANPGAAKAQLIGRTWLDMLLNQPDTQALRVYNTIDEQGNTKIAIVAVDSNGKDILDEDNPIIADNSWTCPPHCDASSPLV